MAQAADGEAVIDRPSGYLEALEALVSSLARRPEPSMLIGGAAVIAHGIPRFTADLDATILASDPEVIATALGTDGIVGRIEDLVPFARANRVLLLEHAHSGVPVDVSLAALPFEEEAIRHREIVQFESIEIPVPRVEDLVIYKLVASRPKDLEDVERLLVLHAGQVDVARVRRILREFCEVLEDEERLAVFETVLRKVRRE